jgi:hypothetical protein
LGFAINKVIHHGYVYIPFPIVGAECARAILNFHAEDNGFVKRNAEE